MRHHGIMVALLAVIFTCAMAIHAQTIERPETAFPANLPEKFQKIEAPVDLSTRVNAAWYSHRAGIDNPDGLKISENFEAAIYPPTGWTTESTGTLYWTRVTTASGYGVGTASTKFNYYSAIGGTTQSLVTPAFAAAIAGDSLVFDYAHAYYNATSIDSLILETSTDGGTTWNSLDRLGSNTTPFVSLSTASTTSSFIPTAAQWGTKRYPLPLGTDKFRFMAISGFGNNLYLDNIKIGALDSNDIAALAFADPLSGSLVVPNTAFTPSANFINAGLATQSNVDVKYEIWDNVPAVAYTNTKTIASITPGATSTVTFDPVAGGLPAGDYTLRLVVVTPDAITANDTLNGTLRSVTPLTGTKTIGGTTPDYATFTAASAALVGSGVGSGGVIFNVRAGNYPERFTIGPVQGTSVTNTILFQREGGQVTVNGVGTSATSDPMILLSGCDYVTFDSIDVADGGTTTSDQVEYGYSLGSSGGTNGANNNTIKNAHIMLGGSGYAPGFSHGILVSSGATAMSGTCNNNKFQNLVIDRADRGIGSFAPTSGLFPDDNIEISGCSLGQSATIGDSLSGTSGSPIGIILSWNTNAKVFGNWIHSVRALHTGSTSAIIGVSNQLSTGDYYNNRILGVRQPSLTSTANAIGYQSGTLAVGAASFHNNFVSNITKAYTGAASATVTAHGIRLTNFAGGGGTNKAYYNSVFMKDTVGAGVTYSSGAVVLFAAGLPVEVINNNLVNGTSTSSATAKSYAIVDANSTRAFLASNRNNLYVNGANGYVGLVGASTFAQTLGDWRTSSTQDSLSVSTNPPFKNIATLPHDLHIDSTVTTPINAAAAPIAGITTDIDGQTRDASTPDIGADEFGQAVVVLPPPVVGTLARSALVPLQGDSVVISCTITDTVGISTANLLYTIDGVSQAPVAMTRVSGTATNGTYEGVLPGSANQNGKRIQYRVEANSTSGQSTTTVLSATNSYFAGVTPLSLSGLKAVGATGQNLYVNYYARVTGTINGPNYQTTSLGYHFQDGVGGINLFKSGTTSPALKLGDSVVVVGKLAQFRGLAEITPDNAATDIVVVDTARTVPVLTVSLSTFNANPEAYESMVVRLTNLSRRDSTPAWPAAGSSANIIVYQTVPSDTTIMRIDSDTEIDGSTEPTYPVSVTGVIAQFTSSSSVYNNGYETQPRYLTDFGPAVAGPLLFEDFNGAAFPPAGWSSYIAVGDSGWRSSTAAPYSPPKHAFVRYNPAGTLGSKILATRRVVLGGSSTYELSFWMRRAFTSAFPPDTVYVKLSTTDSLPASFTTEIYKCYTGPLADTTTNPNIYGLNYRRFSVTLTGYSGPVFLAFDHQDNDGQSIYLDDVTLEETIATHDIGVASLNSSSAAIDRPLAGGTETARGRTFDRSEKETGVVPVSLQVVPLPTLTTNTALNFRALVSNFGAFAENAYQVGWSIDGVVQTPVSNANPLAIGETDTLLLSWATPTTGTHTAFAWTILGTDIDATNDTSNAYVFSVLPTNVLYEEVFGDTLPPAGWVTADVDGNGTSWSFRQQVSFTGGGTVNPQAGMSFWFDSFNSANPSGLINDWLISPQINAANFDSLYFFAGAIGGAYPDSIRVWVSTTGDSVGSFTNQIGYFRVDGPVGSWNLYKFDLSPFDGQNIHVAINYYIVDGGPTGTNSDNLWFDHLVVTGSPVAPPAESWTDHVTSTMRVSVTNEGNIGSLNAYVGTGPGNGFKFNPTTTQRLFEGSIMLSLNDTLHVSDAARNSASPEVFDGDFKFAANLDSSQSSGIRRVITTSYTDSLAESPFGVHVNQRTISWDSVGLSNILVVELDLMNTTASSYSALTAGGFFDWDVNPSTAADRGNVIVDSTNTIPGVNGGNPFPMDMIEMHQGVSPNSWMGVVPLNENRFRGRRIAISSTEVYPPRMTNADKFLYMNSNRATNPNGDAGANVDHAQVFGIGSYSVPAAGTKRVGFALVAGTSLQNFVNAARAAQRLWVQDLGNSINVALTGVKDLAGIPETFDLAQNYPNPFNPTTTIRYALPEAANVNLSIYNLLGQRIATLTNEVHTAGFYNATWNGRNEAGGQVATGVYFYRLEATPVSGGASFTSLKKALLLK